MKHPRPCLIGDRIEVISSKNAQPGTRGVVFDAHYVGFLEFWDVKVDADDGKILILTIPDDQIRVIEVKSGEESK